VLIVSAGCGGSGITRSVDDPDLLYQEDFTGYPDGSMPSGWTVITQQAATLDGPADWAVQRGQFHQASNVRAPNQIPDFTYAPDYQGTMAVAGDTTWVNITYRVEFVARDDDAIGVVFRWKESATDPDGSFYRFLMVSDEASGGPKRRVDKYHEGVWTVLDERTNNNDGYSENRRYVVEIDMVGADFTIRLDGSIIFEFTDPDPTPGSGLIGLFCYAEEGADFDKILVHRRGP
jgi:hypothetical protein